MKNFTLSITLFLCLSICFPACSDKDATDPQMSDLELTIIPGQGISNLRIGDLGGKVASELGDGFELIINEGSSGNATYNYYHASKGIDVIFGQQNSGDLDINTLPIKSFYLFDDFDGMTKDGIKIGSTKEEVVAAFGEPNEIDQWLGTHVYYIGILISYDDSDKVRDITIIEI